MLEQTAFWLNHYARPECFVPDESEVDTYLNYNTEEDIVWRTTLEFYPIYSVSVLEGDHAEGYFYLTDKRERAL